MASTIGVALYSNRLSPLAPDFLNVPGGVKGNTDQLRWIGLMSNPRNSRVISQTTLCEQYSQR